MYMTYDAFENEIVDKIKNELGVEYKTAIKPVNKNNGVVLHGLIISNGVCNISPTIYLEFYFEEYKKGKSIEVLAHQVVEQYNKFELKEDFDISSFLEFDKCRKNISYKLINFEKNKELLKDVPHIVFLDLAIVFYCLIDSNPFETSSILIRNSHMEHWGVDAQELFEIAEENTPKLLNPEIRGLNSIITEMISNNPELSGINTEDLMDDNTMYVITNKLKLYGACCILYKNVLEDFAEKLDKDLIIIPSSVHECLLLPMKDEYSEEYLSELVKEVNGAELSEEDVLSDHVYFYSRKNNEITYGNMAKAS